MKNGTEQYIETVKYLGNFYEYLNIKLFNGELKKPVITVQRDERNKTNGWWSVKKVWFEDNKDSGEHELNLTAQQLNRSINDIAATLIHEMCHQYASVNNFKDTSRSGNYHNKLFKKIAEMHGLNVENVERYGWSKTTLTMDSEVIVSEFVKDNPVSIIYRSPTTAHAVMQLNAEDGGKRKFIMVQIPEPCEEKSEAYKAG